MCQQSDTYFDEQLGVDKDRKESGKNVFLRFFEKNTQSEAIPVCSEMSYGYPYSV